MITDGEQPNIFSLHLIYPEADALLAWRLAPIADVMKTCVVVLDANVLLLPYQFGANSLMEIDEKFRSLAKSGRLVVPGQALREFARHRQGKLADIMNQIETKKSQATRYGIGNHPLLEALPNFKKALEIEKQINRLIAEYQKSLSGVVDDVRAWAWNDPVSVLYGELFNAGMKVLDPTFDEDNIREDLARRKTQRIPPGYKDTGKDDEGIGDILIWHTILEAGTLPPCDLVFVTGDQKSDWWQRSGGKPLYPRQELVDEFRRASGGKSFHLVSLSQLLALVGASAETIEEVRHEETNAEITVMEIADLWPALRLELKASGGRRIEALLASTDPVAVRRNEIILATPYEFHRDKLNSVEARELLESCMSRLSGKAVKFRTHLLERDTPPWEPPIKDEEAI